MKKRLEAELISIAHRVLKLKNKAELDQLLLETRRLYEALSVLKFVEENIDIVKPKMDVAGIEQKIAAVLDQENAKEPIVTSQHQAFEALENVETNQILSSSADTIVFEPVFDYVGAPTYNDNTIQSIADLEPIKQAVPEPVAVVAAKVPEILAFGFETNITPTTSEQPKQPEIQQISFEELLGHQAEEPIFEKKLDSVPTLNDTFGKNAGFGLNDKIGFVKHLFDNSTEDFERVISQIGSFNSFAEAKNFLNQLVKPDYNNWESKEDYEKRFLEIIERKFL